MIDTSMRGIDASVYQGSIEWRKTAADGIRFAMLKATQGRSVSSSLYLFRDSTFISNVRGASAAGIRCGAYHYLTAATVSEAIREAEYFLSVIEPYRTQLPIGAAVDVEDSRLPANKSKLTKIVRTFCDTVRNAGFTPLVYTNPDFLKHRLGDISDIGLWLALWRSKDAIPTEKDYPSLRIWQWGRERLDGIVGLCDADFGDASLLVPSVDYAEAVCRLADLSETTKQYLAAYRWAPDLWRKLYAAMKGGEA